MPKPWAMRGAALFFARFLAINLAWCALAAGAFRLGLVEQALSADSSRLTLAIFAVFLFGLALSGFRAWRLSRELDGAAPGRSSTGQSRSYGRALAAGVDPSTAREMLKTELARRVTFVNYISGVLVTLGLIGTVVGFIMALSGVKPDASQDVSAIAPMVSSLIEGLSVALYTTLVGAVLAVWNGLNYRLLAEASQRLFVRILETSRV